MEKENVTKTQKKSIPPKKDKKPLKKKMLFGILKGKIHYDDSVFNLG
jgi:hypothetical protein